MIDIEKLTGQSIGSRIRDAIADRDKTQKALAKSINISETTLSKIVNGKRNPTVAEIGKIANVLEIPIEYLLGFERDTNFVDNFISLFTELIMSKDFNVGDSGVYNVKNLMYSIGENYMVLTGNSCIFELLKNIATICGQKANLHTSEYEHRLNEARNMYTEAKSKIESADSKSRNQETYFLISAEQISEIVDILIKGERALSSMGAEDLEMAPQNKRPPLRLKINQK